MKKLIVCILLGSVFIFGCGEDELSNEEKLVGSWQSVQATFTFRVAGSSIANWLVNEAGISQAQADGAELAFNQDYGTNFQGSFTFNADGTFTTSGNNQPATGTWRIVAARLELTPSNANLDPILFDFTVTDIALLLQFVETVEEDLDGNNVDEQIQATVEWSLVKN